MKNGFTLLEVLVVLLILALLARLAMPYLLNLSHRIQAAYQRETVLAQLNNLGYQAFKQGKGFTLTQYPLINTKEIALELPEGWKLTTQSPIVYLSNGVCLGGQATLNFEEQKFAIAFTPPFCQIYW